MPYKTKTWKLAVSGVFAAMIAIATLLAVPVAGGTGYIHAADSLIFLLAATAGGGYGALAAGLGSSLADLIKGYTIYALPSFFIKALMTVIAAAALGKPGKNGYSTGRLIFAFTLSSLFMQAGYFAFEFLMYGFAGLVPLLVNMIQSAAGIPLGIILYKLLHTKITPTGAEAL